VNRVQAGLFPLLLVVPGMVWCAGLDLLTGQCSACHGAQGASTEADVPTIAGQSAGYIAGSLRSFRDYERSCPRSAYRHGDTSRPATTMCEIAAAISDEDIDALGAYYSEQVFVSASQSFSQELVAAGEELYVENCMSCHPQGGSVAERGPILAGQWTPYLRHAMDQAMSGEHLVPPFMEQSLLDLSEQQIDALLSFFASRQ